MKKILCATTALVAVGFAGSANAAEPLTASLGGYMYLGGGYSDVDNATDDIGILRDGEVYANITGSSDNGLTFNGHVQIEAFSSGDPIDENWGEVEGSFGAVRFGSDDHASYNTTVGLAFFQGAHINVYDDFGESGFAATNNRFSDDIGIHYYTPRISGFQAAFSYQPDGGSDGVGGDRNTLSQASDAVGVFSDQISVGANYVNDFGMAELGLSAGYDYVDDTNGAAAGGTDADGFIVGASVGAAGVTLGGVYQSALDGVGTDTDDYVASLTYGTGPWTFGAQYGYFEQDLANGGEATKLAGWGEYQIAPGVDFGVGAEYQDTDGGTAPGAFANSEGFAVMAIMGLSF